MSLYNTILLTITMGVVVFLLLQNIDRQRDIDNLEERVYRLERKNDALQYESHIMCVDIAEQSGLDIACPVPSQILVQENER